MARSGHTVTISSPLLVPVSPVFTFTDVANKRSLEAGERAVVTGGSGTFHNLDLDSQVTILRFDNGNYRVCTDEGHEQWVEAKDLQKIAVTLRPRVSLESVVMPQKKRDEIQAAISQVDNGKVIFEKWGFGEIFEKGTAVSMLFWGVPGTGKTLCAQAVADSMGAELKIYGTAEIETAEPGGAERNMQKIFAEAKKVNQDGKIGRVILFDECDSLLVDRNEVGPILGAQINCLLTEIEKYDGIIIFTTNRMGKLDPALERRINAKVEFEFPDKEARRAIWKRMIPEKAPLAKDVDLEKLATYPLAGGNIKNAVLNAARAAAYQKSKKITQDHFITAIERESKAMQAFVTEYEKHPHSKLIGGGGGGYTRGRGSVSVPKFGGDNR